jgi:hypothetical protein
MVHPRLHRHFRLSMARRLLRHRARFHRAAPRRSEAVALVHRRRSKPVRPAAMIA